MNRNKKSLTPVCGRCKKIRTELAAIAIEHAKAFSASAGSTR